MINESLIRLIVSKLIDGTSTFLVDVKVSPSGRIFVALDRPEGMPIEECVAISRGIEENLDRDVEDFELEVSSPGLTEPFKVPGQYAKNLGREVEVLTSDGKVCVGVLKQYTEEGIVVTSTTKVKGQKLPVTEDKPFSLTDVKAVRVHLVF